MLFLSSSSSPSNFSSRDKLNVWILLYLMRLHSLKLSSSRKRSITYIFHMTWFWHFPKVSHVTGVLQFLSFRPVTCFLLLPLLNWGSVMFLGFPGISDGKESAWNAGDLGSIPGLGRSPGEGNGNPLQYSCLVNSMNRGTWRPTVHGIRRVGHNWVTLFFFTFLISSLLALITKMSPQLGNYLWDQTFQTPKTCPDTSKYQLLCTLQHNNSPTC